MNLLIADRGAEFVKFANLPHLSCPIIYEPELLAYALMCLHDEVDRRTKIMREDEEHFSQLPHVVCVIDEFPWFIKAISGNKMVSGVVELLNDMFRFARQTKIHLIVVIHDPKDKISIIDRADIPVGLSFKTANVHKARNTLGGMGTENLPGRGTMVFHHEGKDYPLQGVNITKEQIEGVLQKVMENTFDDKLPRGEDGFSITAEAIEAKKAAVAGVALSISTRDDGGNKQEKEQLARAVIWVLAQTHVSINSLQKSGCIPKNYDIASELYQELCQYGIVGIEEDSV